MKADEAERAEYIIVTNDKYVPTEEHAYREIETKAYNMHESVLDEFWMHQFGIMCNEIEAVAKTTSVYTYKGKYFYIAPKVVIDYVIYCYYDEKHDGIVWEEDEVVFFKRGDDEEINKIEKIIIDWKKYLEKESAPYLFEYEIDQSYIIDLLRMLNKDLDIYEYYDKMKDIIEEEFNKRDFLPSIIYTNWYIEVLKDRAFEVKPDGVYFFGDLIYKSTRPYTILKKSGLEITMSELADKNIPIKFQAFVCNGEEFHESWFDVFDTAKVDEYGAEYVLTRYLAQQLRDIKDRILRRIKKKEEFEKFKEEYGDMCVSFEDSINAGNCERGTKEFMEYLLKQGVDVKNVDCIKAKVLLEYARGVDLDYVKRAIMEAVKKEKKRETNGVN